ncbi:unannotated protein [freshwater metagenome]|uniref:Unannotated protein n=1 Tax=freshwater metagenome TaxID=449393 RepID=A0A6J6KXE6_9ZZZZ
MNFVCKIETALSFNHILELGDDIAILPIEGELSFPVVIVEIFRFHGGLSLALSAKPLRVESNWAGVPG